MILSYSVSQCWLLSLWVTSYFCSDISMARLSPCFLWNAVSLLIFYGTFRLFLVFSGTSGVFRGVLWNLLCLSWFSPEPSVSFLVSLSFLSGILLYFSKISVQYGLRVQPIGESITPCTVCQCDHIPNPQKEVISGGKRTYGHLTVCHFRSVACTSLECQCWLESSS